MPPTWLLNTANTVLLTKLNVLTKTVIAQPGLNKNPVNVLKTPIGCSKTARTHAALFALVKTLFRLVLALKQTEKIFVLKTLILLVTIGQPPTLLNVMKIPNG